MAQKVIVAFVPVLHEGYRTFFKKYPDVELVYLFGKDLVEKDFPHLQKEIRAIDPELMVEVLGKLFPEKRVEVLGVSKLESVVQEVEELVLPDEDVSHELAEKYFKDKKVSFDLVFLRWDKHKSMEEKPVEMDQTISREEFDRSVISELKVEAEKSSDWWRRIASAAFKDGELLFQTHNEHMPSPHSPYTNGDPRNNFHKGVGIELSTSIHSEAALIAQAARQGVSLEGASMYVTVFPCPPCAKLIANAGVKKLYYSGGYVLLDQDKLLRDRGVEIIYVES